MDSKVKTVCQLNQCAGCMSCVDSCPKKAITIHTDLMKYNAVINMDLCVDCNLCHTICPQNNPPKPAAPKYWYQGWANDDEIRKNSASGGFASAIAKKFIEDREMAIAKQVNTLSDEDNYNIAKQWLEEFC